MTAPSAAPYAALFAAQQPALTGSALPWLSERRAEAMARFQRDGLPSQKAEAWKYTSLRPLEKLAFATPGGATVSVDRLPSLLPAGAGEHRLVFVNGRFREDFSSLGKLPTGVTLDSLANHLAAGGEGLDRQLGQTAGACPCSLLALNTAMMQDGVVLQVNPGVTVAAPIELIFVGAAADQPLTCHPRHLVRLGAGSKATLVEHHVSIGAGTVFTNAVTEIELEEGALLHHYRLQAENTAAYQINSLYGTVGAKAHYDGFTMSLGGALTRNGSRLRLVGEEALCHLNGAYMMRGAQHCDTTTSIEHCVPRTACREVFKGVLDDRARAVFQGRILVQPDAQQSDGHQLSKAMLLSDKAEIDAKPELEIYADDVKCSHGATAGDLDHQALFYLRARGIPEKRARSLLIEAFLRESVEAIAAEDLCPAFLASISDWLTAA